jgi:hypothetical protein
LTSPEVKLGPKTKAYSIVNFPTFRKNPAGLRVRLGPAQVEGGAAEREGADPAEVDAVSLAGRRHRGRVQDPERIDIRRVVLGTAGDTGVDAVAAQEGEARAVHPPDADPLVEEDRAGEAEALGVRRHVDLGLEAQAVAADPAVGQEVGVGRVHGGLDGPGVLLELGGPVGRRQVEELAGHGPELPDVVAFLVLRGGGGVLGLAHARQGEGDDGRQGA